MHRTLNFILLLLALASAFALYVLKYDTRRQEVRVHRLERSLDRIEEDIARLKVNRAHLARPERLEPLARALGMVPIGPRHYLRVDASASPPVAAQAQE
ncbi:MAG TPA: cell division protein FtsL [Hyphomicrobiaceae bacterium]|nr:cell division protein FtsL [Hyphomicrobiaceae bacterium]